MDADSAQRESCVLPRSPKAPAIARGFVSSTLDAWAIGSRFADVPLLASELVSNAVRHAEGEVALSLRRDSDRVRLTVSDGSPTAPVVRDLETARDGGWGLHIVERLASSWGLETGPYGKTVWCELVAPDGEAGRAQT